RFTPGLALTYKMDSTPGRHTQGGELVGPLGVKLPGSELPKYQYSGKAEMHAKQMELVHVLNATGGCLFAYISYPVQYMADFLTAITGNEYSLDDLYVAGERIANLRHAFNLREGLNPLEFQLHGRLTGNPPLIAGNLRGVTVDADTMVREYCEAMKWNTETARPDPQRLRELGLEDLIPDVAVAG
ncbi:MAG: aldehyde ferredoxin oxidoreductase C-terminal domain-containing protein, partial [Chloroflexota bacterium]|nr:aldehyde ferredoxin oxidoreductase C-terminal domain-containing protein [Chloroflexota bacterium]